MVDYFMVTYPYQIDNILCVTDLLLIKYLVEISHLHIHTLTECVKSLSWFQFVVNCNASLDLIMHCTLNRRPKVVLLQKYGREYN